jgi:hypothetical protein
VAGSPGCRLGVMMRFRLLRNAFVRARRSVGEHSAPSNVLSFIGYTGHPCNLKSTRHVPQDSREAF